MENRMSIIFEKNAKHGNKNTINFRQTSIFSKTEKNQKNKNPH